MISKRMLIKELREAVSQIGLCRLAQLILSIAGLILK